MKNTWRMNEVEFYDYAESLFMRLGNSAIARGDEVSQYADLGALKFSMGCLEKQKTLLEEAVQKEKKRRQLLHELATVLVKCDNTMWEASLKPQSSEWIISGILLNEIFDAHFVCTSYICHYNSINMDMIKEILFIQSGFFSFEAWNDESVEFVSELYRKFDKVSEASEYLVRLIDSDDRDNLDCNLIDKIKAHPVLEFDSIDWLYIDQRTKEYFNKKDRLVV